MPAHALPDLYQRMLNVPRLTLIVKIFVELFVRKTSSEPAVPPEQERHHDDKPTNDKKHHALAGRHVTVGGVGDCSVGHCVLIRLSQVGLDHSFLLMINHKRTRSNRKDANAL